MSNKKLIPMSVTLGYVLDWGFWEMFRELAQNCMDEQDSNILFDMENNRITLTNSGSIPISALLYGDGEKASDSESRGRHCDGLKNALLVSLREEVKLSISTAGSFWVPTIQFNDMFGKDTLHVEITEICDNPALGVSITIEDVSPYDMEYCKENLITPASEPEIIFGSEKEGYAFEPFEDEQPKLYVGGLYVGDMPKSWYEDKTYRYSYNMPPSLIKLDRDRNSINAYEIQGIIADILVRNNEIEILIDLGSCNCLDVEGYTEYKGSGTSHTGETTMHHTLAQRALALFYEQNGADAYPISRGSSGIATQLALVTEAGFKPVVVSEKLYSVYEKKAIKQFGIHEPNLFKPHAFLREMLEHKNYSLRGKARQQVKDQLAYLDKYFPD